jgi:transposase
MCGTMKKYRRTYNRPAYVMASEAGMTNDQMAKAFGISLGTFERWMREHPHFANAVRSGRDAWDSKTAEESLKKRIMGMDVIEETSEYDDETGQMVLTKRVKKYLAPDVAAIRIWLNNRDPDRWKDKIIVEDGASDLAERLRKAEERISNGKASESGNP